MDWIPQAWGDVNRPTFVCPSTPVTVQSRLGRGPAGQVRTEQVAPVSTGNSVLVPATLRVTSGPAGVMRMDRVGSGAGQALRARQSVCRNLSFERFTRNWGQLGLPNPTGGRSGRSPFHCPPSNKRHTGLGPGGFLVVCPVFSALQGPLGVVGKSEQPKAVFSLLASYPYWPPPLSLGCYRP